jgi:hypothetical protein
MTRTKKPPRPFDPKKAARLVESLRAGDGLTDALKKSRLTERVLFCWLAAAGRKDPSGDPYRGFRGEIIGFIGGGATPRERPPGTHSNVPNVTPPARAREGRPADPAPAALRNRTENA